MDAVPKIVAEALFIKEDRFQRLQRGFAQEFREIRRPRIALTPEIQEFRFFLHPREKAQLEAVYWESFTNGDALLHLVFTDEFFRLKRADDEYRKIRQERYGRVTDVETIALENGVVVYRWTYSGPQPYDTSIHLSIRVLGKNVFVATWNHMLNFAAKPWEDPTTYQLVEPEMIPGTREDAEKHGG